VRRPCPQAAPISTLACSRAPVLRRCMSRSWQLRPGDGRLLARSMAWPPAMPACPAARQQPHRRACSACGTQARLASAPRRPAPAWRRRPAWPGLARSARARWACLGAARRCPCRACRRGPASRRGSVPRPHLRATPLRAAPAQPRWPPAPAGSQALAAVEHAVAHASPSPAGASHGTQCSRARST
jgi:hypothetical protein